MTIDKSTLNALCPMHVVLDRHGRIVQAGPTLQKLSPGIELVGQLFLDIFSVRRPRAVDDMGALLRAEGRKLHMRFRNGPDTAIKGLLAADPASAGAVVNLSFGIFTAEAVRNFHLTSADFAATDLAVEMLYLVEAKSAAMEESRMLNQRLQGAKIAAEERAFTDTLTGLRNRRAMDHVIERLAVGNNTFSVMRIDLDYFKDVNDTLGHAAGDRVLQHVAKVMVASTRKEDTVTRVGGDEFVILFDGLGDRARLMALASDLIAEIEKPIPHGDRICRISASIGISIRNDRNSVTAQDILEQADRALYAAKNAGRAQAAIYGAEFEGDRLTTQDRRMADG
ncbi:diguanylate cyclase domain-containing protein [Aestuariicoccus sp. MJ-SS9]|uniref:diguanylate cyclase domain-containing protein n=1 Tax=Aestuariicoccus sp. MJ-SS9 TaxID=3079855 RepID=UPI0029071CEC|nr:diguanylate cyclase [Aestuariicoccus sp. MJ-SS9]MDU8909976.1 diguanylate cyclase [Aestuariicoccus sp. MJ-SS9]